MWNCHSFDLNKIRGMGMGVEVGHLTFKSHFVDHNDHGHLSQGFFFGVIQDDFLLILRISHRLRKRDPLFGSQAHLLCEGPPINESTHHSAQAL
jgi:hypothetical protein